VMLNLQLVSEELRRIAGDEASGRLQDLITMVDEARGGAERVRKIVRGLKTFARADTPHRRPLDLEAAIEVAVNVTSNEIRHHARLVKEYGRTPRVSADEVRLGQVFINLLVNAAQSIGEGNVADNEIGIKTWTDVEGRAVVEVRDTGCGIPEHLLQRVFDPFFTTKDIGLGTGLGLSISHEIVASLGGLIEVASEVGKGTVIRVVLPACARESAQRAEALT
jgi:signal transduction histidine kinase